MVATSAREDKRRGGEVGPWLAGGGKVARAAWRTRREEDGGSRAATGRSEIDGGV